MRPGLATRCGRRLRDLALLLGFLRRYRSIWLALLVTGLLVTALVMYVVQTAAVAPYVYPLF